jgi:hypothetical protein
VSEWAPEDNGRRERAWWMGENIEWFVVSDVHIFRRCRSENSDALLYLKLWYSFYIRVEYQRLHENNLARRAQLMCRAGERRKFLELYTTVLPAVFLVLVFCWYQICWIFVIRSVSFPPFLYTSPLSSPLFSKRGSELLKKGAIAPLLRKKGASAPFLIPKCRPSFPSVWYWYRNTGEIPTEYRPKIPRQYVPFVLL